MKQVLVDHINANSKLKKMFKLNEEYNLSADYIRIREHNSHTKPGKAFVNLDNVSSIYPMDGRR